MAILQHGLIPSSGQYNIERSLRFNSADSAYLNRTPAGAGSRTTWTWSGWIKFSKITGYQYIFGASSDSYANNFTVLQMDNAASTVSFIDYASAYNFTLKPSMVFRDPSAWYHLVLVYDSNNATSSDRVRMYVNGSRITAFSTSPTYPSSGATTILNSATVHNHGTSSYPIDGYLADVHFIDGSALTPSSFGETDTDTGVWKPKAYTGSYGTNGFKLTFSDNSGTTSTTLGKDTSGNGNNWTPNNFSVTAGAGNDSLVDTPTPYGTDTGAGGEVRGNYATLNPLNAQLLTGSLANGNLQFTGPSGASAYSVCGGTLAVNSNDTAGWYFEVTMTTYGQYACVSLLDATFPASKIDTYNPIGNGNNATAGIAYRNDGVIYNYGTTTTGLTTWSSNNDVIGVAIKDNKIWFAKNNTWISGSPSSGTSPSITLSENKVLAPALNGINSVVFYLNAGQRPFAYTAPSGFKALCTTNLPTPAIGATSTTRADDYFNTVLYTGNGTTQSITGVGFSPDLVWVKSRNNTYAHQLFDSVRGVNLALFSNETTAETNLGTLTAFGTDGFTVSTNSGAYAGTNGNTATFAAWNWRGSDSSAVSNTQGTITSTVSANTTAGFSIVTYTVPSSGAGYTVGHGLGVTPGMIIVKDRTNADDWYVWHQSFSNTAQGNMRLNTTTAVGNSSLLWNNTAPTSTVFSAYVGAGPAASANVVAYCFAPVAGYSAFGSYTGNGSADGPFIYTGFRPRWILVKDSSNGTWPWFIVDTARNTYNVMNAYLSPNNSNAEATNFSGNAIVDALSNGFKVRTTDAYGNTSNDTYIYAAFAENPFKYSLAR